MVSNNTVIVQDEKTTIQVLETQAQSMRFLLATILYTVSWITTVIAYAACQTKFLDFVEGFAGDLSTTAVSVCCIIALIISFAVLVGLWISCFSAKQSKLQTIGFSVIRYVTFAMMAVLAVIAVWILVSVWKKPYHVAAQILLTIVFLAIAVLGEFYLLKVSKACSIWEKGIKEKSVYTKVPPVVGVVAYLIGLLELIYGGITLIKNISSMNFFVALGVVATIAMGISFMLLAINLFYYNSNRKAVGQIWHHIMLAALAFVWLIPIVWLVVTSFSAYPGRNTTSFFPKEWSFDAYKNLLFSADTVAQFPNWFKNTFIIAIFTCIISSIFVLMVAYATSCLRFKMRKPLMNIAVIINLFPGMLSMIAIYFILKTMNLTNSHIGLIIVYSGSAGLGYLIAKGFLDTVPVSLREAARLDGANEAKIFWRVVMPMSKPIIVYTVISSFMVPWMDFVFAKIILNNGVSANWTVAIGLYQMLDKSLINTYFTQFCAGGVLVSIPISILFMIMQKFYVEGITGGAVKG